MFLVSEMSRVPGVNDTCAQNTKIIFLMLKTTVLHFL